MSKVKSFSVGNGDMFYIKHGSDNFTIIDCFMDDDNKEEIMDELKEEYKDKGITRFISTHPDDDHIKGLEYLDSEMGIVNFYCVKNEATKADETDDFNKYCDLRDDAKKSFYIYKGCGRKWMNRSCDERGSSGINILWPVSNNDDFKEALEKAKAGESPNNISPIIKYSLDGGVKILWMGDLENDFMEKIKDDLYIEEEIDILFAPHHGRESGKVPKDILEKLNPKIIIVGEAPSTNLNYYDGYDTITQNSAGDIIFINESNKTHVYVSSDTYSVSFLKEEDNMYNACGNYIGTLEV